MGMEVWGALKPSWETFGWTEGIGSHATTKPGIANKQNGNCPITSQFGCAFGSIAQSRPFDLSFFIHGPHWITVFFYSGVFRVTQLTAVWFSLWGSSRCNWGIPNGLQLSVHFRVGLSDFFITIPSTTCLATPMTWMSDPRQGRRLLRLVGEQNQDQYVWVKGQAPVLGVDT